MGERRGWRGQQSPIADGGHGGSLKIAPDLNVCHTIFFSVLCFSVSGLIFCLLLLNFLKSHILFIFVSPKDMFLEYKLKALLN